MFILGEAGELAGQVLGKSCEAVRVYNFHVEDNHTYYVGTNNILVHNADYKNANIKNFEIKNNTLNKNLGGVKKYIF